MIGSYADDALELICGGSGESLNEAKCKEVEKEKIFDTFEKNINTTHSRGGRQVSLNGPRAERKMAPKSLLPYFVSLFGDI